MDQQSVAVQPQVAPSLERKERLSLLRAIKNVISRQLDKGSAAPADVRRDLQAEYPDLLIAVLPLLASERLTSLITQVANRFAKPQDERQLRFPGIEALPAVLRKGDQWIPLGSWTRPDLQDFRDQRKEMLASERKAQKSSRQHSRRRRQVLEIRIEQHVKEIREANRLLRVMRAPSRTEPAITIGMVLEGKSDSARERGRISTNER